jgi:hypothetical protein
MPGTPDENGQNEEDTRAKLRQIRADYTRARNILTELEGYYTSFDELRKRLDSEDGGLKVNLEWSQKQKSEIDTIVTQANEKIIELQGVATSVKTLVDQVQAQYDSFVPLSAKITDPSTGIEAMLTLATTLKDNIATLADTAKTDATSASTALADIKARSAEVEAAYTAFIELKKEIDDPETGVEAQIAEIKKYASDALKAKTSAESDLLSVVKVKDDTVEHFEAVKASKEEIDTLKTESQKLTDDIRNTLGMTSAYSLSKEIEAQRKKLDRALLLWGIAVAVAVILLAATLSIIFYTLFLDKTSKDIIHSVNGTDVLLTVLSKALFTSPFIFTLYFTTTNYSRTREYRDRYVAKEIASKNLQAYVKLLRDEFPSNSTERLEFALHNMQAIYDNPATTKKRSYNFGINRIFQFGIQEEDTAQLKDILAKDLEGVVITERKKSSSE